MLAIILDNPADRLVSALRLSSFKDFKIYIPAYNDSLTSEEDRLNVTIGTLRDVNEEWVIMLGNGAEPGKRVLGQLNRCINSNPEFDVFHLNIEGEPKFPLKADAEKLFLKVFVKGAAAPLSAFAFRTRTLKEKIVRFEDGSIDPLATVIACSGENKVRTVRWTKLIYNAPFENLTPEQADEKTWKRIEFLRWSERFFGDEDYPLSVGKSFKLFAKEVAALYPARSKEELKEIMDGFETVKGLLRKTMASQALKSAIKARSEAVSNPLG